MEKIYDLLFVRVVEMCSVSSFHTKDIKLDSINNKALDEWSVEESDVKSELFFLRMISMTKRGRKYSSGWATGKVEEKKHEKWMGIKATCAKKREKKREKRNAMRKWMGINSIGGECNG